MTIRLETTCEQCGTTVHSLAYGYSDHFSRNMWHLQCSACGRLTTEQPFDWGDFPASPQQSVITWIPVSERLPEEFATVLLAFSGTSGWLRVWFGHHVEGDWFLEDGPEPDRIENVRFWTTVAPPSEE